MLLNKIALLFQAFSKHKLALMINLFIFRFKSTIAVQKYLKYVVLLLLFPLIGCGSAKVDKDANWEVKFLDEYIIPEDFEVAGTKVGGLSELDFDGEYFYAVCDVPSAPRIYQFTIDLKHDKIDTLRFEKTIKIQKKKKPAKSMFWDSEGLIYDQSRAVFILSSEGSIKQNKDPFIAELDDKGNLLETYQLPTYFKADTKKGLRNNGVFEGLSESVDGEHIWVSTELPMKRDGGTVNLFKSKAPIRITLFSKATKQPEKQFVYRLGRLRKLPLLPFGMNGVTAILNYQADKFFVLERAFSAGHGSHGMRVRLYDVDASQATNTLDIQRLKGKIEKEVNPAEKKLVFDFKTIRNKLTDRIVDNLEGITFGPILPNGNQSLLIISDNNFSSWTKQLNQIILLELIPK